MALASLKSRIERLEAKHKIDAEKVVGVIGLRFHPTIEIVDGVAYLRPAMTPDEFSAFAWQQQSELQRELIAIMGDDAPQAKAPTNVGIVNNPAPLKPGQKQPNFVHLRDGTEIALKRN